MKRFIPLLAVIAAALFLVLKGDGASVSALAPEADGYKCYKARTLEELRKSIPVQWFDQFVQDATLRVGNIQHFCNGTTKSEPKHVSGEENGVIFGNDHLSCYPLSPRNGSPARGRFVTVEDQFGTHNVRLRYPDRLCVEAVKQYQKTVLDEAFVCYRIAGDLGSAGLDEKELIFDDLWFEHVKETEIESLHSLCVPGLKVFHGGVEGGTAAGTNGQSSSALMCYKLDGVRYKPGRIGILDQFGQQEISLRRPDLYCTPARKLISCPTDGTRVYENDFEGAVGSEWDNTTNNTTPGTDTTPSGRRFLGQFGNEEVDLDLDSLPAHDSMTVCFDLFAIQSLDGNDGPDEWRLSVDAGPTLLHSTFSNTDNQQNYPDSFPGPKHPAHTGASEVDTLGYKFYGDSVYRLAFTFPHTASSVGFDFEAWGLQDLSDESWGLDNVVVIVN